MHPDALAPLFLAVHVQASTLRYCLSITDFLKCTVEFPNHHLAPQTDSASDLIPPLQTFSYYGAQQPVPVTGAGTVY